MERVKPIEKVSNSLRGFKQFISRGNVVDLAVGVVIGAGFGGIINAFVKDLVTPFLGIFFKAEDFSGLAFTIGGSKFLIGDFINSSITFVLIVVIVYFFVVLPMNTFMSSIRYQPPPDPNIKRCPECLSEIPKDAKRCAHCTQLI